MQREHFVLIGKAYHKRRALLLDLLPINFSNDPAAVTVFQARHRIIALTDMHLHPLYNCRNSVADGDTHRGVSESAAEFLCSSEMQAKCPTLSLEAV